MFRRWRFILMLFIMVTSIFTLPYLQTVYAIDVPAICDDIEARRAQQLWRSEQDILWFDECDDCSDDGSSIGSGAPAGAGSDCEGKPLPDSVPEYWRNLINNAAEKYPDTDRRAVAAVLWVENRGWPDPNKQWATSSASAKGPFQFIPSSWDSMGQDCNNDGVKDVNDPEDAVCAAFVHLKGSACKPLMDGATGDAEKDWNEVPYKDEGNNTIMSAIQHYNGSGAKSGVPLSQQPSNQNGEYIQMAYWLIASDFKTSYNPSDDQKGDATKTDQTNGAAGPSGNNSGPSKGECSNGASSYNGIAKVTQIDGYNYSFPILLAKDDISIGGGMWTFPCEGNCHHDGTPAFDLMKINYQNSATTGTPVVAIADGTIEGLDVLYGIDGCQWFQVKAEDGFFYAYLHVANASVQNGSTVKAGQQIAFVGEQKCTGNTSDSHLHIDRGNKGSWGGGMGNRDGGFVPLMNKLWEDL